MQSPPRIAIWIALLTFCFAGLLVVAFHIFRVQALADLSRDAHSRLNLFVSSLEGTLEKYEYLPSLVAAESVLADALKSDDVSAIAAANRFLEFVAHTAGASDVYLMNRDGDTVAASNWNLERSFMGRNFGFRPYFQQALEGAIGRYFALGTTSLQRGFYFAYPVSFDREIRGVVVVKVDVAEIEQDWAADGRDMMVTDEDGVIFLTTRPEWLYAGIKPLAGADLERIRASQRYTGQVIRPLGITRLRDIDDQSHQVMVETADAERAGPFLIRSIDMPSAQWTVHILSDTGFIKGDILLRSALAGFVFLIVVLTSTLYLVNRQRQRALEFARDRLETRVAQRTRELSAEVDERRRAEKNLRDTQAELIHTAKMAGLGQMSAGIGHELSQPLTAIRTFADNALRMLERQRYEALAGNLERIIELTGRMVEIIDLLRGFSRKSRGEREMISLRAAVEQALGLFQREIERNEVEVRIDVDADTVVTTDPQLLNQVLVNLVSNALHAVAGGTRRVIAIEATRGDRSVRVCVADSGQGIAGDVIDNIFDPFFTTKEVGLGLGLGLSISYRIMQLLGGRISALSEPGKGARFFIYLPDTAESRELPWSSVAAGRARSSG